MSYFTKYTIKRTGGIIEFNIVNQSKQNYIEIEPGVLVPFTREIDDAKLGKLVWIETLESPPELPVPT